MSFSCLPMPNIFCEYFTTVFEKVMSHTELGVLVVLILTVRMGLFRNISASVAPLNPPSPGRKDAVHSCAQRLKCMSRSQLP